MRMGLLKDALPDSLAAADRVYCYTAGLGWDAAAALEPLGDRLATSDRLAELVAEVAAHARSGDHVLVMSNGGFGGFHERLLEQLAHPDPSRDE